MRRALTVVVAVAVVGLVLLGPRSSEVAGAEHYIVTKTTDSAGTCTPTDCSLREAILAANANPGVDYVSLPAGTYVLTLAGADEDGGLTGDLDVTDDVHITGPGPELAIVDGNGLDRVFDIHDAAEVLIEGIGITGGRIEDAGGGGGGAIRNRGVLDLSLVRVYGNTSEAASGHEVSAGGGGGVFNSGVIWIMRSTIDGNEAQRGSGIFHTSGSPFVNTPEMTMWDSTVEGNHALVGGAVVLYADASILNSTISGNTAGSNSPGLIAASGKMDLRNSTIANNSSPGVEAEALSADADAAVVRVRNSILAAAADGPCSLGDQPAIQSQGHNIATDGSCSLSGPGDQPSTDPMLSPLADNGGPTRTHALIWGSPAIDAGDNGLCPGLDQRGVPRTDGACDIGAFEFLIGPAMPVGAVVPGVARD